MDLLLPIGYKWLVQDVEILHRDISLSNLMYRKKEGKLFGVLNDFDLATKTGDPSPSSKQRTGTKPYMAYELLATEAVIHRYRHDLESLFYVILILTSHFENGKEIPNPPLQRWFSLDSQGLSEAKTSLIAIGRLPSLRTPYAGFKQWLGPLLDVFGDGMSWRRKNPLADDETLGNNITFEKMAEIFKEEIV